MHRVDRISLTERQKRAYDYILSHIRKYGEWPTYRELQEAMGYKSPNSATQLLQALEKKGWIVKRDTYFDFPHEDMPYLTPKIKHQIEEELVARLAAHNIGADTVREIVRLSIDKAAPETPKNG